MFVRYGVRLDVVSDGYKDGKRVNDANNQLYGVLYGRSSFGGIAFIGSYETLARAAQNGTAVPLEGYLADNPAWNALPEDIKSMFMLDGHVYAIPSSCFWSMNARGFYTETLEQTGVEVTDLDTFREYTLALQKTGEYEYIFGSIDTNGLGDILNAYGLYADRGGGHPFSYDPAEDCFVDFLTKDSAVAALEYLRGLYGAGMLRLSFNASSDYPLQDFTGGVCPSYYGQHLIGEGYTDVYTLNPAFPQLLNCGVTGYIMTKDTPQPKETVNFFVNMLFGSEQNYLDCYLGLPDSYTINSDGTVTPKLKIAEDGKAGLYPKPGLVSTLPGVFPHTVSAGPPDQYKAALDDAVERGDVLSVPVSYRQIHSLRFYEKKSDISYLFRNCVMDAITGADYTVEEIVGQYRLDMLNMGGNLMLDEMNVAIGKKTAYYYR